jgi:hypothetical protein
VEVKSQAFLTSALDESEKLVSCSGHFKQGETNYYTFAAGGWVGSKADTEVVTKIKVAAPVRNRNPVVHPTAYYLRSNKP